MSLLSVEVEDEGVRTGDWVSREPPEGDAVPSLESLFFFDDFVSPFPLCSILWPNRFMVVLMWLVVEIGFAIAQQAPGAFVTGAGSAKKGQVAAACVC